MADPFGDQDQSPGGAGKRPAPTIEGTATELAVEGEAAAAAASRAAPPAQPKPSSPSPLAAGTAKAPAASPPAPVRSGNGAAAHMSGELFKMMAGVDIVHIPYRGTAPALTDLLAGRR